MSVAIVDTGLCNLASVRRAFEICGAPSVIVMGEPRELERATHVVLPGVGSFATGMRQLREAGWDTALRAAVDRGQRVLGICLGMQLLAEAGTEGGATQGLGLIPGSVERMEPRSGERLPHVGWNSIRKMNASPLFDGIDEGTDLYFVHSYQLKPRSPEIVLASVSYCGEAVAAVGQGHVFGVQFHPEKSAKPGFQLIRNFLAS